MQAAVVSCFIDVRVRPYWGQADQSRQDRNLPDIAAESDGGLKEKPGFQAAAVCPRHEHGTRSFGLLAHSFGFYLTTAIASLTFPSRTIGRIGSTHLCCAMTSRGPEGEGTRKRTRDSHDENSSRQDRKKNLHFILQ